VLPLVYSSLRSAEELGELPAQRVGRRIVAQALRRFPMPPGLPLPNVFEFLDRALLGHYRLRGQRLDQLAPPLCDAMGRQKLADLDARGLTVIASDPFTCSSAIGYFTELIHHFDAGATLTHLPGPCRREGHAECRYRVAYGRS
jgi:hypothetical protein